MQRAGVTASNTRSVEPVFKMGMALCGRKGGGGWIVVMLRTSYPHGNRLQYLRPAGCAAG